MPHMLGLFCEKNMAIQAANLGTAPSGAGGDTFRSAATKFNENFSNNAHAASRLVGTQAGNVMEVGAFGLGGRPTNIGNIGKDLTGANPHLTTGFYEANNMIGGLISIVTPYGVLLIGGSTFSSAPPQYAYYNSINGNKDLTPAAVHTFKTTQNTTVDGNGFIKNASPIVKLFADKIELNNDAQQQNIEFEKLGVGDYLVKGSSGFAQEGWYIETPKDANGNLLVAVVYEQLANGDISVKTYDYMLNKKGRIVADTETPLDIPENRWIDLRLQELPQPEIEVTDDTEQ